LQASHLVLAATPTGTSRLRSRIENECECTEEQVKGCSIYFSIHSQMKASSKAISNQFLIIFVLLAITTHWLGGVQGKIASNNNPPNITGLLVPDESPSRKGKPRWRRSQQETKEPDLGTSTPAPAPAPRRQPISNKTATQKLDSTAAGCHEYVSLDSISDKWRAFWHRRGRKPKVAYKMAILASMSYWEFHKWALPNNTAGFRLSIEKGPLSIRCIAHGLGTLLVDVLSQSNIQTATYMDEDDDSVHLLNATSRDTHNKTFSSRLPPLRDENHQDKDYIKFEYWMYNWYEPTGVAGVNFHDTDILVATADNDTTLTITFAGTQSTADAITSVQTFEPANHSSFFQDKWNQSLEGSLHRGFLNAYSRVSRGRVLRLENNANTDPTNGISESLHRRFGHCTVDAKRESKRRRKQRGEDGIDATKSDTEVIENVEDSEPNLQLDAIVSGKVKEHREGGCMSRGDKLMVILREAIFGALSRRQTVHIIGHSLGGGLATLTALDIIINFPEIPVSRLHLWTFGAPQISDDIFLASALQAAPRLKKFIRVNGNGRFHRYITMSDKCKPDVVSVATGQALNTRKKNFHGRAAHRLGGVHGDVVHLADPKFLLTPDQYSNSNGTVGPDVRKRGTTTHSAVAAHALLNYLHGISRESKDHPLRTDLPSPMVEWIGEIRID
jgi:hypothetical protein